MTGNKIIKKKISIIKKSIKLLLLIVTILFSSFYFIRFSLKYKNIKIIKKNKIEVKIREINNEIKEVDRRVFLTKTYIDTWNNSINKKRKEKDGIDVDSIKKLITDTSNKYLIKNFNMSLSLPNDIKYYAKKSVKIMNSELLLSFNCLSEYDIYYFINDLYKYDGAFFIIENLEIKKIKNITKEFIKDIIDNGDSNSFILSVKLRIQWYEFLGI